MVYNFYPQFDIVKLLKHITVAYIYADTSEFSKRVKQKSLDSLLAPFQFENSQTVLWYGRAENRFGNHEAKSSSWLVLIRQGLNEQFSNASLDVLV